MGYKLVTKIKRKGYPTSSAKWRSAHTRQNNEDRAKEPRLFAAIQKRIDKMPSNELAATHTYFGNVKVSSKFIKQFPKKMRKRVINHLKRHEIKEHLRMI